MERLRKKGRGQYEDKLIDICKKDFHIGREDCFQQLRTGSAKKYEAKNCSQQ